MKKRKIRKMLQRLCVDVSECLNRLTPTPPHERWAGGPPLATTNLAEAMRANPWPVPMPAGKSGQVLASDGQGGHVWREPFNAAADAVRQQADESGRAQDARREALKGAPVGVPVDVGGFVMMRTEEPKP